MKEIIYRCWDRVEEKFAYSNEDNGGYEFVFENKILKCRAIYNYCDVWDEDETYHSILYNEVEQYTLDCEVEQYTGLKDKNGKMVFENDIVRCWSGEPKDYYDFRELIGTAEYVAPYFRVDGNHLAWSAEFFEIIGNTHETTEGLDEEYYI